MRTSFLLPSASTARQGASIDPFVGSRRVAYLRRALVGEGF